MKNTKFNQKQGDGKIEKMCDYQQKIFKNIYLKNQRKFPQKVGGGKQKKKKKKNNGTKIVTFLTFF